MKLAIRRISILFVMLLVVTVSALSQQCQATTKKGTQCKRKAIAGSIYCSQHTQMYGTGSTQSATQAKTEPSKNITTTTKSKQTVQSSKSDSEYRQCQAITKKGTRCTRKAVSGSKYCWQHKNYGDKNDK
ncbi:MAG: hypothetical protein ABSC53_03385 [Bacteroidota bacterium]|jgi:hypothetical protein